MSILYAVIWAVVVIGLGWCVWPFLDLIPRPTRKGKHRF